MKHSEIKEILNHMSIEEKVVQLCGVSGMDIVHLLENGTFSKKKCKEKYPNGIGHICQFASGTEMMPDELADIIAQMQAYMQTETKSKIPILVHDEVITGLAARGATITPQVLGMSCSWNPDLVYKNAQMTAENMKKLGCYYALSPMMDVIRDARWGRGEEGYGEDSYLVTLFASAFIDGLQSKGVAATVKHFAGYGSERQDLTYFRNEILPPFETAIKHCKVKAVMPAYHTYKGIPCTASAFLLSDILRKEWGFDGLVVSDYGAISNLENPYHYVSSAKEDAITGLSVGVDVDVPNGESYQHLIQAYHDGKVSMEQIDTSVLRVLLLKNALGLFDHPIYEPVYPIELDSECNRNQALTSAHDAIVLLKNNGILPLKKDIKKILVTGPNADSYYSLLGDYTWTGIAEFFHRFKPSEISPQLVTFLSGLRNDPDIQAEITFERGCDWSSPLDRVNGTPIGDARGKELEKYPLEEVPITNWKHALELGAESDIIFAAMGENRYLCGENCDRDSVLLPGKQEQFVLELCELGVPVVLVVFGGRPMAISSIAQKCAAVIYAWYPGEEGGTALADIISGRYNPTGKLTVSLPNTNEDVPIYYQQEEKIENCVYPFGTGLSYTNYVYSNLEAPAEVSIEQDYFDVCFDVENTGNRFGTEIVQLYQKGKQENSKIKLIGFTRVSLEPKEKKSVTVRVFLDRFSWYTDNGELWVEPQDFQLNVAASCKDVRLKKDISIIGKKRRIERRYS